MGQLPPTKCWVLAFHWTVHDIWPVDISQCSSNPPKNDFYIELNKIFHTACLVKHFAIMSVRYQQQRTVCSNYAGKYLLRLSSCISHSAIDNGTNFNEEGNVGWEDTRVIKHFLKVTQLPPGQPLDTERRQLSLMASPGSCIVSPGLFSVLEFTYKRSKTTIKNYFRFNINKNNIPINCDCLIFLTMSGLVLRGFFSHNINHVSFQ